MKLAHASTDDFANFGKEDEEAKERPGKQKGGNNGRRPSIGAMTKTSPERPSARSSVSMMPSSTSPGRRQNKRGSVSFAPPPQLPTGTSDLSPLLEELPHSPTRSRKSVHSGVLDKQLANQLAMDAKEESKNRRAGMTAIMAEAALSRLPFFQFCSPEAITALTLRATCRDLGPGQIIISQGQKHASMLIPLRGTVNVTVGAGIGSGHVSDVLGGKCFGETHLLGIEEQWAVTITTTSQCSVYELSRKMFLDFLTKFNVEREEYAPNMEIISPDNLRSGTMRDRVTLFQGLSSTVIDRIDSIMIRKLYFPQETIISKGQTGEDIFLLVHGSASAELCGRTVRVFRRGAPENSHMTDKVDPDDDEVGSAQAEEDERCPLVLGEVTFLGISRQHNTTIVAKSACHVRILSRRLLLDILQDFCAEHEPDAFQAEATLLSALKVACSEPDLDAPHRLPGIQGFRFLVEAGFSSDLLDFLNENLEVCLFRPDQTIADSRVYYFGERCFHSLIEGEASAMYSDGQQKVMTEGVCGNMKELGFAFQPLDSSRVVAVSACSTQALHQNVVVRAMELFPEEREMLQHFSSFRRSVKATSTMSFYEALQNSSVFANFNEQLATELAAVAREQLHVAGDWILDDRMADWGDDGSKMFIVLEGNIDVLAPAEDVERKGAHSTKVNRKHVHPTNSSMTLESKCSFTSGNRKLVKVARLGPGSVCGEMAMLGVPLNQVAIRAVTNCIILEITQANALPLLARHPEERDSIRRLIAQHLDFQVAPRIMALPLFQDFDRKFKTVLTLCCQRLVFFPDVAVVREGEEDNRLYIMNLGQAMLQKKGVAVKFYNEGMHFGAETMLGISTRQLGTVLTMSMCHVLVLSRQNYETALDQYPSADDARKLLRSQKNLAQEMRHAVDRAVTGKLIWQRYQGAIEEISDVEFLKRVTRAWRQRVTEVLEVRSKRQAQEARNGEMLKAHMEKARGMKRIADHQRKVREIVQLNATSRGVLIPLPVLDEAKVEAEDRDEESRRDLVNIFKAWPSPRPSPNYSLHLWEVIGAIDRPGKGLLPRTCKTEVLPLLTAAVQSQEKKLQRTEDEEAPRNYPSSARASRPVNARADRLHLLTQAPLSSRGYH